MGKTMLNKNQQKSLFITDYQCENMKKPLVKGTERDLRTASFDELTKKFQYS